MAAVPALEPFHASVEHTPPAPQATVGVTKHSRDRGGLDVALCRGRTTLTTQRSGRLCDATRPLLPQRGRLTKIKSLSGSRGSVNGVDFSPGGRILAGAGSDGAVGLWDARTLRKEADLAGHPAGPVNGVTFSPADAGLRAVATNTADGTAGITFWNLASRKPEGDPVVSHRGLVTAVASGPDGAPVAAGSDTGAVTVWDVESRTPTAADAAFADPSCRWPSALTAGHWLPAPTTGRSGCGTPAPTGAPCGC